MAYREEIIRVKVLIDGKEIEVPIKRFQELKRQADEMRKQGTAAPSIEVLGYQRSVNAINEATDRAIKKQQEYRRVAAAPVRLGDIATIRRQTPSPRTPEGSAEYAREITMAVGEQARRADLRKRLKLEATFDPEAIFEEKPYLTRFGNIQPYLQHLVGKYHIGSMPEVERAINHLLVGKRTQTTGAELAFLDVLKRQSFLPGGIHYSQMRPAGTAHRLTPLYDVLLAQLNAATFPMQVKELVGGTAWTSAIGTVPRAARPPLINLQRLGWVQNVLRDIEMHPVLQLLTPRYQMELYRMQSAVKPYTITGAGHAYATARGFGRYPGWYHQPAPLDILREPIEAQRWGISWAPKPGKEGAPKPEYFRWGDTFVQVTDKLTRELSRVDWGAFTEVFSNPIKQLLTPALTKVGGEFKLNADRLTRSNSNLYYIMNAASDKLFILRNAVTTQAEATLRFMPQVERFRSDVKGQELLASHMLDFLTSREVERSIPSREYGLRYAGILGQSLLRDLQLKEEMPGYRGYEPADIRGFSKAAQSIFSKAMPTAYGTAGMYYGAGTPAEEARALAQVMGGPTKVLTVMEYLQSWLDEYKKRMHTLDRVSDAIQTHISARASRYKETTHSLDFYLKHGPFFEEEEKASAVGLKVARLPGGEKLRAEVETGFKRKGLSATAEAKKIMAMEEKGFQEIIPEIVPEFPITETGFGFQWTNIFSEPRFKAALEKAKIEIALKSKKATIPSPLSPRRVGTPIPYEGPGLQTLAWQIMKETAVTGPPVAEGAGPSAEEKLAEQMAAEREKFRWMPGYRRAAGEVYGGMTEEERLQSILEDLGITEPKMEQEGWLPRGEFPAAEEGGAGIEKGLPRHIMRMQNVTKSFKKYVNKLAPLIIGAGVAAILTALTPALGPLAGIAPFAMMGMAETIGPREHEKWTRERLEKGGIDKALIDAWEKGQMRINISAIEKEMFQRNQNLKSEKDRYDAIMAIKSLGEKAWVPVEQTKPGEAGEGEAANIAWRRRAETLGELQQRIATMAKARGVPLQDIGAVKAAAAIEGITGKLPPGGRYGYRGEMLFGPGQTERINSVIDALTRLDPKMEVVAERQASMAGATKATGATLIKFKGELPTGDVDDYSQHLREQIALLVATSGAVSKIVTVEERHKDTSRGITALWHGMYDAGKKLSHIQWEFVRIQMAALGMFFSMQGLLRLMSMGLEMITNPLKDINSLMESYAYAQAFANETGLDLNDMMEKMGVSQNDLVEGWMKMKGLFSFITAGLGALGAAILKDPEVWKAIQSAISKIFDILSDPETIQAIKDMLIALADSAEKVAEKAPIIIGLIDKLATIKVPFTDESILNLLIYGMVISWIAQPLLALGGGLLGLGGGALKGGGLIGGGLSRLWNWIATKGGRFTGALPEESIESAIAKYAPEMAGKEATAGMEIAAEQAGKTFLATWAPRIVAGLTKGIVAAGWFTAIYGLVEPVGGLEEGEGIQTFGPKGEWLTTMFDVDPTKIEEVNQALATLHVMYGRTFELIETAQGYAFIPEGTKEQFLELMADADTVQQTMQGVEGSMQDLASSKGLLDFKNNWTGAIDDVNMTVVDFNKNIMTMFMPSGANITPEFHQYNDLQINVSGSMDRGVVDDLYDRLVRLLSGRVAV